ncbi:Cloroperoxidase [Pluteus cervinus]|uniref:Cloroperoxidase n=1 Tax=Pluteus cervinus TaxID=181527 RepID=A0ACD3AV13_9AGAR|nr:Cloroperoxidase [Pluteus cervinus]
MSSSNSAFTFTSHPFVASTAQDSRAPCPALNSLANHGYIHHNGCEISFFSLLFAIHHIYNLSIPLSFLLTFVGFLSVGHITWVSSSSHWIPLALPSWRINLSNLSQRGPHCITHDASLVHVNVYPSTTPDQSLVKHMLNFASHTGRDGLSLPELASLHSMQCKAIHTRLDNLHEQIALGECGLAWAVMRSRTTSSEDDVIPYSRLATWFGKEELPEDWWDVGGSRPKESIGLFEARERAEDVSRYTHAM